MNELINKKTQIGWVLRDMMQSTGIWTFDMSAICEMAENATEAGFSHIEVGGGQSFQIALQNHTNPYQLLRQVKSSLASTSSPIPPQILLRGANQFGFHHFSKITQQRNLDLLIESCGDADKSKALVIRIFDALNDVENLRFCIEYLVENNLKAELSNHKKVSIQVALSYVAPASKQSTLYSVEYYVAYAKTLREIAFAAGGDLDSFCIKDMSGQLNPSSAIILTQELKKIGLPVVLHCHSTDGAKSLAAVLASAQTGIDAIEVALHPLAGGASHHDVRNLREFSYFNELNNVALDKLEEITTRLFAQNIHERKDFALPIGSLKSLVSLGIPGGAIPFVVHDLQEQVCSMLGIDLNTAMDEFAQELRSVQNMLGHVPLVTPTADIIAKQVIKNLGNRARAKNYKLMDPRFCALVLGHYGDVIDHATGSKVVVSQTLIDEVIEYCESIELDLNGLRIKAGREFPEPIIRKIHPSLDVDDHSLHLAEEYVAELASRYPESVARFGTTEECVMMQVMRPAGNNERLLTRNILEPTEQRLRLLLDKTLHLLPSQKIPEARDKLDNETTDLALLNLLGDYEGIITNIKDLVIHVDQSDIQSRLDGLKDRIVGDYCKDNEEASTNRLYVERRFVALFAAAVFWDLQRICRRTGADSRKDIDEITANSLGRMISITLRKRKEEGMGSARSYLV